MATHSFKTEQPPCCLRINHQDKTTILGTYLLDKPSGRRTGSLDVLSQDFKLLSTVPTESAILDLKYNNGKYYTAHSTGEVQVWEYTDSAMSHSETLQVYDSDTLITSLVCSPWNDTQVFLTTTNGECSLYDLQSQTVVHDFQPHSLEAWTSEFGNMAPLENIVITGGDDATIQFHDIRSGSTVMSNSRIHGAGVVAIKTSSETFRSGKPTSILTGSYDDCIRELDLRMMGETPLAAIQKQEVNLGGGVWRFSELPNDKLFTCCMYDGARVVDVSDGITVEREMKEGHESMVYGCDYYDGEIVSCSFYDCSVQKWDHRVV